MQQDLIIKCERCGQVQALPSSSRSAQDIAEAEETEVIIDDLKGTESTALLNFRAIETGYATTVGNSLLSATLPCDVCNASLYFPEQTLAIRCAGCKSLVIRKDATLRDGHKLMRCQNGDCHCLFIFLTGSTSFVRCPSCRVLRSETTTPTVRCRQCYRYFQIDSYVPSFSCPHCSRCMSAGCTLKGFWTWIAGGLVISFAMFLVILLFAIGGSSNNWNGLPEAILFFFVGLGMIIWPILACLCCRRGEQIAADALEETLPYSEIQHPEALDESVNHQSFPLATSLLA